MGEPTPGPWTYQRALQQVDGAYDFAISAPGAPVLAEAFGRDAHGGFLPAEDNARVLAAAHDLWFAAKGIEDHAAQMVLDAAAAHQEGEDRAVETMRKWQAVLDAIAKAGDGADAQSMATTPALIAALQRLETAAERRDTHMGDPCRLLDAKAELAAAAKHAREVLASAEGRS